MERLCVEVHQLFAIGRSEWAEATTHHQASLADVFRYRVLLGMVAYAGPSMRAGPRTALPVSDHLFEKGLTRHRATLPLLNREALRLQYMPQRLPEDLDRDLSGFDTVPMLLDALLCFIYAFLT